MRTTLGPRPSRTTRARRAAAALAASCGVLLAAACSSGGGEEDPGDGDGGTEQDQGVVAEAERLFQIVNDSHAVALELEEIEQRVVKRCMEDAGFDVHDPAYFPQLPTTTYTAAGYLTDAPIRAVPTPEAAAAWGFGAWIDSIWSPANEEYREELLTPEARLAFNLPEEDYEEPDTSEWDAEGADYQAGWIEAYTGAPPIEDTLKGPQADESAPMGGCELEMVETMYGEPYVVEEEEGEYEITHRPSPIFGLEEAEDFTDVYVAVEEERIAFESCLIDGGYEGWELGEELYPPLWQYFGQMYDPAYFAEFADDSVEVPELPDDAPTAFLDVLEYERAMAGDFAVCGRDSGLRAAIEEAWAARLVDAYLPIEADMTAWQTEMQGHLDSAQDYLQE